MGVWDGGVAGCQKRADKIFCTLEHYSCILINEQHLSLTATTPRTTELLKPVTVQVPQFEYYRHVEDCIMRAQQFVP